MSIDKQQILAEIRRTSQANGGVALGQARFAAETGIRAADYLRYWARYGDAVREAGLEPRRMQSRYDDDRVLRELVLEIRRIGRVPTKNELYLRRRNDPTFPSHNVYAKFGAKRVLVNLVADFCARNSDFGDVLEILEPLRAATARPVPTEKPKSTGFVYLLKSGRYHKIGRSNSTGRREYELKLQLPEPAVMVHEIATDDPEGIEDYWHRRFASRRRNGEWFVLFAEDVRAFKRRKFM